MTRNILTRDVRVKWMDFGPTLPSNLNAPNVPTNPHPSWVWLKSAYSESVPWHRVRVVRIRNAQALPKIAQSLVLPLHE